MGRPVYAPESYLIWSDANSTSAFIWASYPVDGDHTRLVSRIRWSHDRAQPRQLAFDSFTDVTDHLAVRKLLQAEGRSAWRGGGAPR
jgi:hypothetical protein